MEVAEQTPRSRGSYFAVVGEIKEFKTQAELKTFVAAHDAEEGELEVIKGKSVNVKIENKPVVSLEL